MNILGLSNYDHDPAAALLIDGKLVAAVEEERLIRKKHAQNTEPYKSARWCLDYAGIDASKIDAVAFPFAPLPFFDPGRWYTFKRLARHIDMTWTNLKKLVKTNQYVYKRLDKIKRLMEELGCDLNKTKLIPVLHHLAHASSAYHFSGFAEKTAIIGVDGKGECSTTFFGYGENGKIHKIKEFYMPDSLGLMYGTLTEYLGFDMYDGEFKVMGMAPYGDAARYDLSRLIDCDDKSFRINTNYVNCIKKIRHSKNGRRFNFSNKLIEWLGPMREGDAIDEPYIHYAASVQQLLEDTVLRLTDYYLGDIIRETGKVCYAGGVALNVKLNQKLLQLPHVRELFVQPASHDAGTAIGAASYVANNHGEKTSRLKHVYLGPSYSNDEVITACREHAKQPKWQKLTNTVEEAADILAAGNPLAWFQGRMEFGPRALGNRSILGDPTCPGIADRINSQIKYRERWRPFCPSMLDRVAADILQSDHPAEFMTITFPVASHWHDKIPEVVHEDGTARAQVVSKETNPRYYALIEALEKRNGVGVVLNTSLNRRGEPMICTPHEALEMFYGSDLQYLIMEDVLVTK